MLLIFSGLVVFSCKKEDPYPPNTPLPPPVGTDTIPPGGTDTLSTGCPTPDFSNTTPYNLNLPAFVPPMPIPTDNPITVEGVHLGRFLFWEPELSVDGTISCGSCHAPESGFSDPNSVSIGVGGATGTRQSMSLTNVAWANFYFWDGRAATLESQVFHPILDPVEMGETVDNVLQKLENDPQYPPMFEDAFGSPCIDSLRVSKAIAQFLRTMVSFNAPIDRVLYGPENFTQSQFNGYDLFQKEGGDPADGLGGQWGADCFHCHGGAFTFYTDHQLHNNGLDAEFTDPGAYAVTGNALDMGRFKTPTLRNVEYTAPYMHDGRFSTLEEVVEHYNSGGHPSTTIDPFMKYTQGGLQLSEQAQADLVEFLKMLSDEEFIQNPAFSDPH